MRVLHVVPSLSPSWGGPVSAVLGLVPALERKGVQSSVIATYGLTGERRLPGPDVPATVFRTNALGRLWIAYAPGLASAVRGAVRSCDVVHIHELWHYPHWVAARTALHQSVPYVISPHGEFSPWALCQKAIAKRIYAPTLLWPSLRHVAALHALSETELQQIRDFGVHTQTVVIPNGVPASAVVQVRDAEAGLRRFPKLRDKRIVLFLGRLQPQKGPDVLLEAWSAVQQAVPSAHLLMAGPGDASTETSLRAQVRRLGLEASVTFAGPLFGIDKKAALSVAELFVLPSRSEGQSIALLEAMASNLPVVVTAAANFPDVAASRSGLVSTLVPSELAYAVVTLLHDAALRREFGQNGRAVVEREYTWDRIAGRMRDLYCTLLPSQSRS